METSIQTKPAEASPAGARAPVGGDVDVTALVAVGAVKGDAGSSALLMKKSPPRADETLPDSAEPESNSEDR